jgi:hypothetical protein
MKQKFGSSYFRQLLCFLMICVLTAGLSGCNKVEPRFDFNGPDASSYPSDVIDKWITLQIRLMRDATGIPNVAFSRHYAYSGIVAFESLKPGLANNMIDLNWNGLSGLPQIEEHRRYFWPASVNAGLAAINKSMFPTASTTDLAAIDSLGAAINSSFNFVNPDEISRSNQFGSSVAAAIFSWAETDGYKNASAPYTLPVGPGSWVPTPPAFAAASTPYWGNNRTIISGSIMNTQPDAPVAYSEDPNSDFFKMVKQMYDVSQTLTTDQTNQAVYWRDIPGVTSPGHWLSILQQVLNQTHSRLGKTALSYAVTGVCLSDACISCWQTKYKYNLVRPITYLQTVMGFPSWTAVLSTPAHPEYSSAHAVLSSAAADAFSFMFGNSIGNFTDHTYDYLGFPARSFDSFKAIGEDAGYSRLYAGIHYLPTVKTGLWQGRKVTSNIISIISREQGYKK